MAYTWIEWLEYNVNRALGNCMDEEEKAMGLSQVRQTIDRIRYIKANEEAIKEVLRHL